MKRQLTLALSVLALSLLFGSTPEEVVTSSFTQNQFKVAWYSSSDEQGYLRYGTSTSSVTTVVYDERGSSDTDKIHSVLVSGLDYDTMYYFSIQSGSTFDDNGGVFYSVKTAQADFSFDPDSISLVNVYSFQSTTAVTKDSIVFATIEKSNGSSESLPISFLYNSSSNSSPYTQTIPFGNFKSSDGSVFSVSDTDILTLEAWTADDGFGGSVSLNSVSGVTVDITLDSLTISTPVTVDSTAPNSVTSPSIAAGANQVTLQWTTSNSTDVAGTKVIRSTTGFPATVTDGTQVYIGIDASYTDTGLTMGTTYNYTLFAYDSAGNFAEGVTVFAVALGQTESSDFFDTFEDNDSQNNWDHYWYTFDDTGSGGDSSVTHAIIANDGADGTTYSIKATYTLGTNSYAYREAVLGTQVTANGSELDMSSYTGVELWVKGSGESLSIVLSSGEVSDANNYSYTLTTNTSWTQLSIPFTSFTQESWGVTKDLSTVLSKMENIQFKAGSQVSGESGWFSVDEMIFVTYDYVAPEPVTGLTYSLYNDDPLSIKVQWTASTSGDNAGTRVLRRSDTYPSDENDGTTIYQGTSENVLDETVTLDTHYYYSVYALDDAGNASTVETLHFVYSGGSLLSVGQVSVSDNFQILGQRVLSNDYVESTVTVTIYLETSTTSNQSSTLNIYGTVATQSVVFTPSTSLVTIDVALSLSEGSNTVQLSVSDWNGDLSVAQSLLLKVAASNENVELKSGSQILTYPMPFDPDNGSMVIAYELTKASDLDMYIYSLNGQLVWRDTVWADSDGGKSGYNEVSFSGMNSFGQNLPNGLYILRLVASGRVLGTGKFLVIR